MIWAFALATALFATVSPEHAATRAYNVALGVGCEHCHTPGNFSDTTKPAFDFARRMAPIFDLIPTDFDAAVRMPRTQCYMCHQGRTVIERVPQK